MKTVYAIHTGPVLVDVLKKLFPEHLPGVRLVNVVDDGLLADVRTAGHLIPSVTRRLVGYGVLAQASGADAIFNCCSSVGEAADLLAKTVDIPVVKIDDRMASEAVRLGRRIGILATVVTTLDPTERLVQRKAAEAGKKIETQRYLNDGAFDALVNGDAAKHDAMVAAEIERAMSENDVVVLAQGSMARIVPTIKNPNGVPVLSSPLLGIQALKEQLGL
ncbi:MAG: aspartate/glutamate racemase family protein [Acidobacteria bacterium]|nr:aspartate/glutamate racemase family protein [Acidobacteriota bacterium]